MYFSSIEEKKTSSTVQIKYSLLLLLSNATADRDKYVPGHITEVWLELIVFG